MHILWFLEVMMELHKVHLVHYVNNVGLFSSILLIISEQDLEKPLLFINCGVLDNPEQESNVKNQYLGFFFVTLTFVRFRNDYFTLLKLVLWTAETQVSYLLLNSLF